MFLAPSISSPWKTNGWLVANRAEQILRQSSLISLFTHCGSYLRNVIGLMPKVTPPEADISKEKFKNVAHSFKSEPTALHLPPLSRAFGLGLVALSLAWFVLLALLRPTSQLSSSTL